MNTTPRNEERLREELSTKMQLSFAKGGFLTTDLDGEWEYDEKSIIDWLLSHLTTERTALSQRDPRDRPRIHLPMKSLEKMAKGELKIKSETMFDGVEVKKIIEFSRTALIEDMKDKMRNWHGSGPMMIDDYLSHLESGNEETK